jgi:hypothetical protein
MNSPNAVLGVFRRHGPPAQLDPELFASLFFPCSLCSFFMRLVDAEPAAFALRR